MCTSPIRHAHLRLSLILAVLMACSRRVPGQAEPLSLPDHVRKALIANAEALTPIDVTWTEQFVSSLDETQTLRRLEHDEHPSSFFFKATRRVALQNCMMYSYQEVPDVSTGSPAYVYEQAFDGKVHYFGVIHSNQDRTLFKRYLPQLMQENPRYSFFDESYFDAAGYTLPRSAQEWAHQAVGAKSQPLFILSQGGTLESVEYIVVEGRKLLRISLLGVNPVKRAADSLDLEQVKRELEWSIDPPEKKKRLLSRILRRRALPAQRRYVYYLDPSLNYAVRLWEQWYAPDTLLRKCVCSDFQQLDERQIWLPRKCTVYYHEFSTVPGKFFKEAFLWEVFEVQTLRGKPIDRAQFVLDYKSPGTLIKDGTIPEAKLADSGYVTYVVPANKEDLDAVVALAKQRAREGSSATPTRRTSAVLLLVANFVGLLCVGLWALWKVRGRGR